MRLVRVTLKPLLVLFVLTLLAVTIGPRVFPYQVHPVLSGSMDPAIPTGSLLVVRPAATTDLRVGDIITFNRPGPSGTLVTHRIREVVDGPGGRSFVTQGDANGAPDPWLVPGQGSGWRYALSVPYAGYGIEALQSYWGHILALVLPAGILGAMMLRGIWKPTLQPIPGV